MAKIDPQASVKIDAYYQNAENWSQPICTALRQLIHKTDSRIQEDWKWRAPNFCYMGLICWVVPFKSHVGINFFKGSLIEDTHGLFDDTGLDGKHNRIIKITSEQELKKNTRYIKQYLIKAVELNVKGVKPSPIRPDLVVPDFLLSALSEHTAAKIFFSALAYSHKREYIEWLTGAKREATRISRLEKALDMLNRGVKMHDQSRK